MALFELSDGLSNEAHVSLGNKLVCSKPRLLWCPLLFQLRSVSCPVETEGGWTTKYTRRANNRSRKKKGAEESGRGVDESHGSPCWSIYISFQWTRALHMLNEHSAFYLFTVEGRDGDAEKCMKPQLHHVAAEHKTT